MAPRQTRHQQKVADMVAFSWSKSGPSNVIANPRDNSQCAVPNGMDVGADNSMQLHLMAQLQLTQITSGNHSQIGTPGPPP